MLVVQLMVGTRVSVETDPTASPCCHLALWAAGEDPGAEEESAPDTSECARLVFAFTKQDRLEVIDLFLIALLLWT